MKVSEIPQDKDEGYGGQHKIRYGKTEAGDIIKVQSSGWSIEKDATDLAWKEIFESLKLTHQRVLNQELSPLAYHLEKALLTPELMAQNLGMWTFTLKRHLKPKVFGKLNLSQLEKYAQYLDLTVDQLKTVPEIPETSVGKK